MRHRFARVYQPHEAIHHDDTYALKDGLKKKTVKKRISSFWLITLRRTTTQRGMSTVSKYQREGSNQSGGIYVRV
jgi:hypothetical protein